MIRQTCGAVVLALLAFCGSAVCRAGEASGSTATRGEKSVVPLPARPAESATVRAIRALGGRRLTSGSQPSWSPDGRRLAFAALDGLKILDLDSGKVSHLIAPGKTPAWSPGEGRHIAYVAREGEGEAVWLVKPERGTPRRLVAGAAPAWSADGKTVYFHAPAKSLLQALRIDSKDASPTDVLAVPSRNPAISADGTRVACRRGNELAALDIKTGKTLSAWPLASTVDCTAAWSPDGKQLAFGNSLTAAAAAGPSCAQGLWVLDAQQGCAVQAAAGPCGRPAWSADGTKIAFEVHTGGSTEIWMLETGRLGQCASMAPASGNPGVPEAAFQLIGRVHRPQGHWRCVDLSPYAHRKLSESTGTVPGNDLKELAPGEQTLAGVKFRIGEGVIQLGGKKLPAPERVEGIRVGRRAISLHFLHATQYGDQPHQVADGTLIGKYEVCYADGSVQTIPVIDGEDVRDWWSHDGERGVTRGQVVWLGRNEAIRGKGIYLRLYLSVWRNPHPEKRIAAINYLSTMTPAAPFCVAITADEPACARP